MSSKGSAEASKGTAKEVLFAPYSLFFFLFLLTVADKFRSFLYRLPHLYAATHSM